MTAGSDTSPETPASSDPTIRVTELLGSTGESRFADRRIDRLVLRWNDANKRRLVAISEEGRRIALDLPRGTFLNSGTVLTDDGVTIVVATRKPEAALVVPLESHAQAARIGHAFGNQHVPVEIVGDELRVPITTSVELMTATVEACGGRPEVRELELWTDSAPPIGHSH